MAVDVDVSDIAIIRALNTPGGAVFKWRDDTAEQVLALAFLDSPVGDPMDAGSRGGVVGVYRASWGWDRIGSNGHIVRATIYNRADHAIYVEEGRGPSTERQVFTWSRVGGRWMHVGRGGWDGRMTRGFPGRHILRNALAAVLGAAV